MRVVIFGTGGVGGYFGARLASVGEDVVFIARGEHLTAIRTQGLRVDSVMGDILIQPAQATDDPMEVGTVDAVLLGVKTWQVPEAGEAIRPLIGPDTLVVPLQNGVEAPFQLQEKLGADHVVGGLCGAFSFIEGPGHIRHIGGATFIKFGELDNSISERLNRLRQAFIRADVSVEIPKDIHGTLWEKFLFVVPFGGVGAVTRAPIGVIMKVPETRKFMEQGMREIYEVARARNIALSDGIVDKSMAFLDTVTASGTSSLQRDIIAGKPSELDAWAGAVVRFGKEAGVDTPLHTFLYHSLLPMELRARGKVEFPE